MASERQSIRHALVRIAVIAATTSLTACSERKGAGNNTAAVAIPSPTPSATAASLATKLFRRKGPDMLSTVGLYEGEPLREVDAAEGKVTIQQIDGVDTLMVDGKPARYLDAGIQGRPADVAANNGLALVGVFELPGESVAWAIITGGSACPGTHVLVPIRDGAALPGQSLPGCDDRGTMRLAGDRIVFEAGESTGFYQNGLVSLENPPTPM